jgi:hypothetical protein
MSPKVRQRILQLHAMLGSSNEHEQRAAHAKLEKLLAKHGLTWNDLPAILADARADQTPPPQATTEGPSVNVLDLTLRLLEEHCYG